MKKVYQRRIDPGNGDCMQCVIASLFDVEYEQVPDFISEKDGWFRLLFNFIHQQGYEYDGMLHNKVYQQILIPNSSCFEKTKWHYPNIITKSKLQKESGVNGFFFASVLSPKYTKSISDKHTTHAVVIDKDYNIVHDPNPEYKNIIQYPLSNVIGYNGIIDVFLIC